MSESSKDWDLKVAEMDRLARLHLDVPYSTVQMQGHYLLVKLGPVQAELPLKRIGSGIVMPAVDQINQVLVGIVIAMGRYTFEDGVATKWNHGPLCKVGDYIMFYNGESSQTLINGYRVATLRDANIMCVTDNPGMYGTYVVGRFKDHSRNLKTILKRKDINDMGFDCEDTRVQMIEDFDK